MDSAKQTAAPGFLAPEGEVKKEGEKEDIERQQNKSKKRAEEGFFGAQR